MPHSTEPIERLDRWKKSLSKIQSQSNEQNLPLNWRGKLTAKVLSYLIARYEDKRCWNKHVTRLPFAVTFFQKETSSKIFKLTHKVHPPRCRQELLPALLHIRQANRQSYQEYGISVGKE